MKKADLQKALEIAKPGLSNKEQQIEQTNHFAFIAGRVVTYNDEISVSHPVEGLEIEGAVKADVLYSIISKIKAEDIDLSVNESEVVIKSGKMTASIALQHEVSLPLEEVSDMGKFKKIPDNLITLLHLAAGACPSGMDRPVLTCVNVMDNVVQASDGFKIIEGTLSSKLPVESFLIPAPAAMKVCTMNPNRISVTESWVHFKNSEGTTISCRTFEDTYPAISHILSVKGDKVTLPTVMPEILERAWVFAVRESASLEVLNVILTKKKITVKSQSDYGKFEESAIIKFDGAESEFSISPYLLKGILKQTLECIIG